MQYHKAVSFPAVAGTQTSEIFKTSKVLYS